MQKQDRPLLIALLALVLALAVNAAVSLAYRQNQPPDSRADKGPRDVPEWWWGAAESLATITIAGFAVRQYFESTKSSQRQLRAYVLVSEGNTYDASRVGLNSVQPTATILLQWTGYAAAELLVRNSGQTPAKNVRHWAMIAVSSAAEEHMLIPPAVLDDSQASVIGAGNVITKTLLLLPFPLTEPVLSEIHIGAKGIYVFGKIQYDDIFGTNHTSTYRLRYSGAWPPLPSGNFNFCLHGNDFD